MKKQGLIIATFIALCSCSLHRDNTMHILYFNDAHELNPVETPIGEIGGVSRMKTVIDSLKLIYPNSMVLFGGDLGGGTLGGKLFRGSVMVTSLNELSVDYANFGQHEFDYGIENTNKLVRDSHFRWFTSNIRQKDEHTIQNASDYIIRKIGNYTVGIIGLTDKVNTSKPSSGVIQMDIISSARRALHLMGKVDYCIAVTQMDMKYNEKLLKACPEISLILTEETSQYKTEVQFLRHTPIVAAAGNMGNLVNVAVDKKLRSGIAVIPIDSIIIPDEKLASYARMKTDSANILLNKELGAVLPMDSDKLMSTGKIVAHAFRTFYNTQIGIIHGGGVRALLPNEKITLKDVFSVLPFENRIIPVRLSGNEIVKILQTAAGSLFPQVAGMTFTYLKDNKFKITDIKVEGFPIQLEAEYTVALPDYIVLGGGDFEKIPRDKWLKSYEESAVDSDVLLHYILTR